MISILGAAFASFFATLLAMSALRPMAVVVDLVDKPGGRKTHRGEIPIVGGIAMFLGMVFGIGLVTTGNVITGPLIAAAALVVIVGLLDDRFELSPFARLPAHLAAAVMVMATSGVLIKTLGSPFGSTAVVFSNTGAVAFTCVAIVGAINAFNMLDGMDGLAGTTAFIALSGLAIVASTTGETEIFALTLVCAAAVAAFLVFNIPARFNRRFRCFMGDAGSTLLGFLLACICILISQGDGPHASPTTTMWFVAIPLYELLSTTLRRLLRGRSPFQPDREHFHHKLLDAGFGVRGAFIVLIVFGSLLAALGVGMHLLDAPDFVSFALWLVCGLGMVVLMNDAKVLWYIFPERLRRALPSATELV